ncbi:DUF2066 domain-containing protein [Mesorhizobium sp. LHD-90]|uniref:DUF2066 domain-containing protein n=1 Tax=Mesorhizobium sp. LHD-90 TaxID=3071414 RepID=UPI0027E1362B|nr:DUF2066 domain-containing protein [Mesorhizobium sp. LHD-90]MDQ6432884.1 DUF2066 domain-containing protein [Mesorhizobium sp. LHD-90]
MPAARTFLFLASLAAIICAGGPARALDLTALYTTQAIVTGSDERHRQLGFEECFREVLVKVTGDRTMLRDPAVAAALPRAGSFVRDFRYRDRMEDVPIHDEQGTHDRPHDLTCVLDRDGVDAFLKKLGRKPWLQERPRIVMFLAVKQAAKSFMLSRNGSDGNFMRQSLAGAGEPLALPVDLPDSATLSGAALNADTLPKVELADLDAIAARYDGALALAGILAWSEEDRGWVADWRIGRAGQIYEWQQRGVSFDDAFRGALAGTLQVISGNGQP